MKSVVHRCGILMSLVVAILGGDIRGSAQKEPKKAGQRNATVVYDVKLREFTCWSEGTLIEEARAHPCDFNDTKYGWHSITGELYFVRGESVNLLLVNAASQDLFSLDVKADDLAEPTVPISGSLTELPKLLPIPPAPTVVAGTGVTFAATTPSIKPSERIYRLISTAEEKDFKGWVQGTLLDPMKAKEVTDLSAVDLKTAIEQLSPTDNIIEEVVDLQSRLDKIPVPTNTSELVSGTRSLVVLVDSESALRYRLIAAGITASGKVINDYLASLRSTPLQRALAIDSQSFARLTSDFELAFPPGLRYARINAITISGNSFGINSSYKEPAGDPTTDMADFLHQLTSSAALPLNTDTLKRVKTNLTGLADSWDDTVLAQKRRADLEQAQTNVVAQRDSSTGVFQLQKGLNALVGGTIQKAGWFNEAARTLPLESALCTLPVGQWFGSKTITVSLKQGQRTPLFDVGGVSESTRTSVTGADNPVAKAAQGSQADLAVVRTFRFRVFNLYHFQIGLGFVYSTADDNRFQVTKVTTDSESETFIDQTRARDYNLLGTVNVIIFPSARHAFPWRPRYVTERKPAFYHDLGAMFGFSVTSPNKDFLLGGAWFPRPSPVGLQVAWHIALRDYPPKGIDISQPIPGRVVTLEQRRLNGVAIGLVFTTDFFSKVFAPIFKP